MLNYCLGKTTVGYCMYGQLDGIHFLSSPNMLMKYHTVARVQSSISEFIQ